MDIPTVVLSDEAGRSLLCYVEHSIEIEDQLYALLMPVHTPVNLFVWEDEEDDEPILVEDDGEIARVFSTAQAVLEEQNLKLQWSAVTLTVEGEVPDLEEEKEEAFELTPDDLNGSDHEEFQLLARFYHEEEEYGVYIPLDPLLILTRLEEGKPKLLDTAEFERIEPILEARLAEELDT